MMAAGAVLRCWTLERNRADQIGTAPPGWHDGPFKGGLHASLCRGAVIAALVVAYAGTADAQRVKAGVLTCDVSAGIGLIVGSQRRVACVFAPELPGPAGSLFRLDHQVRARYRCHQRRHDGVGGLAAGGGSPGFLAGDYVGATATSPSRSVSGRTPGRRLRPDRRVAAGFSPRVRSVSISPSGSRTCNCVRRADLEPVGRHDRSAGFGVRTASVAPYHRRRAAERTTAPRRHPGQSHRPATARVLPRGCRSMHAGHVEAKAWINATSSRLAKRPGTSRCPVRMLVTSTMRASFVLIARILATHFAGSQ